MHYCFAGAESHYYAMEKINADSILVSAYYMRKNLEKLGDYSFVIVDSGAATFMGKKKVYTEMKKNRNPEWKVLKKQWDDEVAVYEKEHVEILKTIYQWKKDKNLSTEIISVELDVHLEDKNAIRREKTLKELKKIDKEAYLMPVWHMRDDFEVFRQMCQKYPYIGIGGIAMGLDASDIQHSNAVKLFQKSMVYARNSCTKIHAFGVTIKGVLERYPFYSIDSTSWLSGSKYGTTFTFDGRRIKGHDKAKKDRIRKSVRQKVRKLGIEENFYKDKAREINIYNASVWLEFSKFLSKKFRRTYWMGDNGKELTMEEIMDKKKEIFSNTPKETSSEVTKENAEEISHDVIETTGQEVIKRDSILDMSKTHNIKVTCDNCYIGDRCPMYKPGHDCAYTFGEEVKTPEDLVDMMQKLLGLEGERVFRTAMFEKMDGGYVDENVSKEIASYFNLVGQMKDILDDRDTVTIKAKGKGIISQIFGKDNN